MFFYHQISETKSQILHIDISFEKYKGYTIRYHIMEQEGAYMESYYQSRYLSQYEIEELTMTLSPYFSDYKVPIFIIEKFYENINK